MLTDAEPQSHSAQTKKPGSEATHCVIPFIRHSGKGEAIGTGNPSRLPGLGVWRGLGYKGLQGNSLS